MRYTVLRMSAVALAALWLGGGALAADGAEEKLILMLKAEPASPSGCLEMLDTVQMRAEERVTENKVEAVAVDKIGGMIKAVEAQCQAGQFKDAEHALEDVLDQDPSQEVASAKLEELRTGRIADVRRPAGRGATR